MEIRNPVGAYERVPMSRQSKRHYTPRVSKYNSEDATYWRDLMRKNNWTMKDVAMHLRIGYQTITTVLSKDALGELE